MRWTLKLLWTTFGLSFGLALFIWFAFSPPIPGVAIAALAVLAFVMTLVLPRKPSKWGKILWMMGAFALMFIEILAISHDRQMQESNFRVMLTDVEDSIKTQTGGDTFAFIALTPEPGLVTFNNFPHPAGPYFLVSISSHGKYPLRAIHATLMDDERRQAAVQEYNKHPDGDWLKAIQSADVTYQYPYLRPQSPEAPGGDVQAIGAYPIPSGNSMRLTINFSSLNGYWDEVLHLGLVNGQWHNCLSLLGPTVKQFTEPFIWCDSDWPEGKILAEKDWPQSKPQAQPVVR
jgi:hypothetical protein